MREFQIRRVRKANGLPAGKRGLRLVEAKDAAEALRMLKGVGLGEVTAVGDDGCYAYGYDSNNVMYDAVAFDDACTEPAEVAAIPYS